MWGLVAMLDLLINTSEKLKKSLSNGVDANVPPPTPFSLGELKITWTCLSSDDSRVGFHGVAMLNPYTKKWVLDWSRIIGGASTKREERWLYHWFRANYKIIPLNSINSSGYAIVDTTQTEVGSIPEEFDKNAQSSGPILLSFCLVRSSKALCGNGSLGPKQDGPNGNLTSYALKIIRSIEFVD